jgi:hypothetical protein
VLPRLWEIIIRSAVTILLLALAITALVKKDFGNSPPSLAFRVLVVVLLLAGAAANAWFAIRAWR